MSPEDHRSYRPGYVLAYPYLWQWQQDRSENDGRKVRPVCVVAAVRGASDGLTHLALLAITSGMPGAGRTVIEIPEIEARRARLGREVLLARKTQEIDSLRPITKPAQ